MFQKEVADRIIADVNSKNYSRITILANWRFNIKKNSILVLNVSCLDLRLIALY